jgi:hypothetical protein
MIVNGNPRFSIYKNNPNYSLWLFFLLVPALLCGVFPGSMGNMNCVPACVVVCRVPRVSRFVLCTSLLITLSFWFSLYEQHQTHHASDQVRCGSLAIVLQS